MNRYLPIAGIAFGTLMSAAGVYLLATDHEAAGASLLSIGVGPFVATRQNVFENWRRRDRLSSWEKWGRYDDDDLSNDYYQQPAGGENQNGSGFGGFN